MANMQTMKAAIGAPAPRVDGRLKVTGAARYGADMIVANPAYAVLATSPIARGRISGIDERSSRQVAGVLDVLTYETVGERIKPGRFFFGGGYVGSTLQP